MKTIEIVEKYIIDNYGYLIPTYFEIDNDIIGLWHSQGLGLDDAEPGDWYLEDEETSEVIRINNNIVNLIWRNDEDVK